MLGAGLLNIGSLVLGLIAWVLPAVNLAQAKNSDCRNWALSVVSVSACAVALCMQIFYSEHLVKIQDWSALMDTSHSTAWISTMLLVVTIVLNTITFVVYHKNINNGNER
ncbi:hypothetical protein EQM14_11330 [Caproiciproducens sp. NJN-50]|nr:hypothetical protein [Caproicibacter sp. BJN0012]QAT51319.1 hypothetical protein EQM14_11330 [Caproiciproducens sp. NJN-50]